MTTPTIQSAEDQPPTPVTATIPADLLQAYVELQRAAECQLRMYPMDTIVLVKAAVEMVHRAAGGGG